MDSGDFRLRLLASVSWPPRERLTSDGRKRASGHERPTLVRVVHSRHLVAVGGDDCSQASSW